MRTRLTFGVLFVASAVLVGWFGSQTALPTAAAQAKDEKKAIADDRDDLSAKLMQRVTFDKTLDQVPLKDAIEFLNDKYDLTILVDARSFDGIGAAAVALQAEDEVFQRQVSVPAMRNVRLATILKHVADQLDGVYLLYPDHIKIVSIHRAFALTHPPVHEYQPQDQDPGIDHNELVRSIPLVHVSFKEVSLQDALREVELRTNRSIVLASQAGEKAKMMISARFTNVPVDTAVATLAESAGLKMARKGNVLLVTTAERAKEFAPPALPNLQGLGGFGFGLGGLPQDPQVEELKKKVADLEKIVDELKKK